jgi:hypothetical protein
MFTAAGRWLLVSNLIQTPVLNERILFGSTEATMELILIVVVLVLLFGGGGGYWGRRRGIW